MAEALAAHPEQAAELHGLERRRRDEHDGRVLLEALVQHVHRAQVQGGGIPLVALGSLGELVRDLALRVAEDDARLPLAFGLGLHRHRIL